MNSLNRFSRESVKEGFKAVKGDALDAFVYDATVLEYLVGQDDECNVLTVGSWYAMTGKQLICTQSCRKRGGGLGMVRFRLGLG